MTRDKILKTLEEKGDDWVIAAMIEDSIGYHSVNGARILIEDIKNVELRMHANDASHASKIFCPW